MDIKFMGVSESDEIEKSLIVAPVFLSLIDNSLDQGIKVSGTDSYVFIIGVVPKVTNFEVKSFQLTDLWLYCALILSLCVSLLLTTCCVFQMAHAVIKPLRVFNTRMNEILQEDNYNDVNMNAEDSKCREIKDL